MKKAAHFLLLSVLEKSPPNDALTRAYTAMDVSVDFYAPDQGDLSKHEANDRSLNAQYGLKWCLKNLWKRHWKKYDFFSCTSEDPIVIAGILSVIHRKPLIFLSDEIRAGSYRGNRSEFWKKTCRWAMRRAALTIVNDESRVALQRSYASLKVNQLVTVYPGCFLEPPKPILRTENTQQVVMAYSGSFTMNAGVPWALQAMSDDPNLSMLIQPIGVSELNRLLLKEHRHHDRIKVSEKRLNWQESWQSMGGGDIGISIYHNPSPQFQNMGISSNRLCMFIAMGVPVIVSRQPSFQFIEDFQCGFMVENQEEFNQAVKTISENLPQMKQNALRCAKEYIDTASRYETLLKLMQGLTH